jgi:hypothetical protein
VGGEEPALAVRPQPRRDAQKPAQFRFATYSSSFPPAGFVAGDFRINFCERDDRWRFLSRMGF